MTMIICIGGPLHGQYKPATGKPIAAPAPKPKVEYTTTVRDSGDDTVRVVAVAMPPRPVLYYPTRLKLPGWRVLLPAYVEAHVIVTKMTNQAVSLEVGSVMPGGIVGAPAIFRTACRWCYGRPLDGLEVCSRSSCILNVSALESLETLTADDAKGWIGDE